MNIKEEHSDLIDAFLRGELIDEKLRSFESLIASDREVAQELEVRKLLSLAIRSKGADQLRMEMGDIFRQEAIQNEEPIPKETGKKNNFWKYGLILIVGLLLAALWYMMRSPAELKSGPTYYASYFEAYDNVLQTRGDEIDSLQAQAMSAYENKRYDIAIPYLEQLSTQNDKKTIYQLYLGISYMEENEFAKAENAFSLLSSGSNPLFHDHGNWYSALNYIKQDQIKKAIPFLQALAEDDKADFSDQAKSLLAEVSG